jgi:hypothetical protein
LIEYAVYALKARLIYKNGDLDVSKTIDFVSIPNLSLFFFICHTKDDSEEAGKGLSRDKIDWGLREMLTLEGGQASMIQRAQWLVRATAVLVSKKKVGGGMDQRVARQQ